MSDLPAYPSTAHYLMEHADLLLFVLEADGKIIVSNNHAKQVIGEDNIELAGTFPGLLVEFIDRPSFEEFAVKRDQPTILNIKTARQIPQTYHFHFYPHEEVIYAFGKTNQLEIQQLQENLIHANNDINNLARDLQKSNVQLKKLNDLKNQFLGMAAHDLRNPVGIVSQFSEFLMLDLKEVVSSEHYELIQTINATGEFLLNLLDDLLDVSVIESGHLNLHLQPLDVTAFLKRVTNLNSVFAERKGIQLALKINSGLPAIDADESKLEQVMNNLLSNAVKYSNPQTVVTVSAQLETDHLEIAVSDQGQGIPEEDQKQLFKAFQTTSVRATSGEKSVGLGLAIVKRIVEGHQGAIRVDSELGAGTTFTVTLPLSIKADLSDSLRETITGTTRRSQSVTGITHEKEIPSVSNPVLDKKILDELGYSDHGFLEELITLYLEQSQDHLLKLSQSQSDEQRIQAKDYLKQLCGASETIGATLMAGKCNEILKQFQLISDQELKEGVEALSDAFMETRQLIEDYLKKS